MQMAGMIRKAKLIDIPHMVELSEQKRVQYQEYQPTFWRKADDSREQQAVYFESLLNEEDIIALVYEQDEKINGFIIAILQPAPAVYDPGGLTCVVDDFAISTPEDWKELGNKLLEETLREAKNREAIQAVVVCGHLDEPKRMMLQSTGFSIASEWYVREI